MIKKRCIWLFVLLLMISFVGAQDKSANVFLTLKDINTNEDIDNVVVYLELNGQTTNQYVSDNEILKLRLENGLYSSVIKVDDLSTTGRDYFKKTEFFIEDSLIQGIFLFPVGSLRGIVKDKLDNIVPNADLKFECSIDIGIDFPDATDKFGTFNTDVPVGLCKIFASYKRAIGFKEVEIKQGSLEDVEIKLDKSIVPSKNYFWLVILVLIVIVASIIYKFREEIGLLKKKEKRLERKEMKEEEEIRELEAEIKLGKRARDILETLKDREKEIIEFLVESKGKSTQAKIYHETGIPKASLFRYVQSLENKKIIEVKKIGKMKKIKFTDWFLEKK